MTIFDEPKFDSHLHIFDPQHFPYRADAIYRPAGQEIGTLQQFERVMAAYGVQRCLLVNPTSGYRTDSRYLLEALDRHPATMRGIAVVDIDCGLEELASLKARGVVGVAFNPATEGMHVMAQVEPLFARLAELGMFAQIQVQGDELVELTDLIERTRPPLLIDHCGRPDREGGIAQPGMRALLGLSHLPNIAVKLSGMQKFARANALYDDARPYVHALLEKFGAERCMWGSDWPFLRHPERIDYGTLLHLARQLLPDPAVRRAVMWSTPNRLFGFEADVEHSAQLARAGSI